MIPSNSLQTVFSLPLAPQDFLRCLSAIIIFLVVSFAAVTSREGAAIAAFVSSSLQRLPAPRTCGWHWHTSGAQNKAYARSYIIPSLLGPIPPPLV